jgi:hypothetical protein
MVRRRAQGLDFMLGFGGYDQTVLKAYLETLTRDDFFRYIILLTQDNKPSGMVDARSLLAVLEDPGSGETFQDFATLLNHGSDADRRKLAQLLGFVPAEDAVTKQSDKRDVLTRMENSGRDWLPVVSANGQLDANDAWTEICTPAQVGAAVDCR